MRRQNPLEIASDALDCVYAPIFNEDQGQIGIASLFVSLESPLMSELIAQSVNSFTQSFPNEVARINSVLKWQKLLFASLGLSMGMLGIRTLFARAPTSHTIICGFLCHDFFRISYNSYVRVYIYRMLKHTTRDIQQFGSGILALGHSLITGTNRSLVQYDQQVKWEILLSGTIVQRLVNVIISSS